MLKIFFLLTTILLASCSSQTEEKPVIYTTVYPVEYIVSELIGDNATVKSIIPAGSDPHSFEPTQQDIRDLADSDMYFHLGLSIETLAQEVDKAVKNADVISIKLAESFSDEIENDGIDNEHIWINPIYNIKMSKAASKALIENFPNQQEEIEKNLEKLVSDFEKIDEEYFKLIEESNKDTIIVSHDSYAYYQRYGIYSLPVKDESHSKDPTQSEINEIIETGIGKNINMVLYDQNIPSPPLDIIKRELNADSDVISNLSTRTYEEVKNNVTLIDLMMNNLEVLKKALS